MLTPQQIADKQVRRAQEAAPDYVAGVDAVTVSPGALAAKKKDKYRNNVIASVDKWAANTGSTSLDYWKAKTKTKGGERYASGVEQAKDDIVAFHEEFQPFVQRVRAEVNAMPDTSKADRKAKMNANFDKMAEFKRTRKRR